MVSADMIAAQFSEPTTRYAHAVLGDNVEWGTLEFTLSDKSVVRIVLPQSRVFEDLAPRLVDIDQDGQLEAMVVESSQTDGARLAIYTEKGLKAATPYIGRRNRWLAPIGAADLNSDGAIEVAYIDRPHLAKTLRVWSFQDGKLVEIANKEGLTNHRIGEDFISSGVSRCGGEVAMITADAQWHSLMRTTFKDNRLISEALAPFTQANLQAALSCQ